MKIQIIILVSFILFILYHRYNSKKNLIKSSNIDNFEEDERPKLWFFTNNNNNTIQNTQCNNNTSDFNNLPKCLQMSIKSIYKYCDNDFNIIHLSPDNVHLYLPDLSIDIGNHSSTNFTQQEQIIKSAIMYRYGGLWIPASIIILQPLLPIIEKLDHKEIVLFGCSDKQLRCFKNTLPNFEVVASRPYISMWDTLYNQLIQNNRTNLNSSYDYYNIGRQLLWKNCKNMYDTIYTYDSRYDGTRDYNRKLITNEELFSTNNILLQDSTRCFFLIYNFNNIKKSLKYKWFLNLSIEELMTGDIWISKIYRLSLLGIDTTLNDVYNTSVRNT